jgi:hypothetical protein
MSKKRHNVSKTPLDSIREHDEELEKLKIDAEFKQNNVSNAINAIDAIDTVIRQQGNHKIIKEEKIQMIGLLRMILYALKMQATQLVKILGILEEKFQGQKQIEERNDCMLQISNAEASILYAEEYEKKLKSQVSEEEEGDAITTLVNESNSQREAIKKVVDALKTKLKSAIKAKERDDEILGIQLKASKKKAEQIMIAKNKKEEKERKKKKSLYQLLDEKAKEEEEAEKAKEAEEAEEAEKAKETEKAKEPEEEAEKAKEAEKLTDYAKKISVFYDEKVRPNRGITWGFDTGRQRFKKKSQTIMESTSSDSKEALKKIYTGMRNACKHELTSGLFGKKNKCVRHFEEFEQANPDMLLYLDLTNLPKLDPIVQNTYNFSGAQHHEGGKMNKITKKRRRTKRSKRRRTHRRR